MNTIKTPDKWLTIAGKQIGSGEPTYFIADIAANHDGDLERAKDLIHRAAEAGADAAKFQHFKAATIVSDAGFRELGHQLSHQSSWKKSVFEIYKDASIDPGWTPYLKKTCDEAGITFFTSPYDADLVDAVDPFVPAYKIGSGDITWLEIIRHIASKNKPFILATGASTLADVRRAVEAGLELNSAMALMQCNTNYTADPENFKYIQLNVLSTYRREFPDMVLGLSDHTLGHSTVLGAVSLGACVVEKHFTDDVTRNGPDHKFSMDPRSWNEMVARCRELENALGSDEKRIEANEAETVVLQRRCVRAKKSLYPGRVLAKEDLEVLRPCPKDGIPPYEINEVIGRTMKISVEKGELLRWSDLK